MVVGMHSHEGEAPHGVGGGEEVLPTSGNKWVSCLISVVIFSEFLVLFCFIYLLQFGFQVLQSKKVKKLKKKTLKTLVFSGRVRTSENLVVGNKDKRVFLSLNYWS